MPEYSVAWSIDLDADSPRHAAQKGHQYQQGDTTAVVFEVSDPQPAVTATAASACGACGHQPYGGGGCPNCGADS